MKFWDKFLIFLIFEISSIISVTIVCKFSSVKWTDSNFQQYNCLIQNKEILSNSSAVIVDNCSGQHMNGKQNANVQSFSISDAPDLKFFPKNFDKIFTNLIGIVIYTAGLEEIHQNDLKKFPKLKFLYLSRNKIEKIEFELFRFNPDLEVLWLNDNKISQIDPFVFSELKNLRILDLGVNNLQKSFDKAKTREEVIKVVKEVENMNGMLVIRKELNKIIEMTNAGNLNEAVEKIEKNSKNLMKKFNETEKNFTERIENFNENQSEIIKDKISKLNSTLIDKLSKFDEIFLNLQNFSHILQNNENSISELPSNFSKLNNANVNENILNLTNLILNSNKELNEKLSKIDKNENFAEIHENLKILNSTNQINTQNLLNMSSNIQNLAENFKTNQQKFSEILLNDFKNFSNEVLAKIETEMKNLIQILRNSESNMTKILEESKKSPHQSSKEMLQNNSSLEEKIKKLTQILLVIVILIVGIFIALAIWLVMKFCRKESFSPKQENIEICEYDEAMAKSCDNSQTENLYTEVN